MIRKSSDANHFLVLLLPGAVFTVEPFDPRRRKVDDVVVLALDDDPDLAPLGGHADEDGALLAADDLGVGLDHVEDDLLAAVGRVELGDVDLEARVAAVGLGAELAGVRVEVWKKWQGTVSQFIVVCLLLRRG